MSSAKNFEAEFEKIRETEVIGRKLEHFNSIDSTNGRAKELALEGAKEGTVVVADEQRKGRGRMGRDWYSPKGEGLWFSIVLYPTQSMAEVASLTILVAKAIKEFLSEQYRVTAKIKQPNDLLVNGKKICGILAEAQSQAGADEVDFIIVGVGLNISTEFPKELRDHATALAQEVEKKLPPRPVILSKLLQAIEERYLI